MAEHQGDASAREATQDERTRTQASLEAYWELLRDARRLFAGEESADAALTAMPDFSALARRLIPDPPPEVEPAGQSASQSLGRSAGMQAPPKPTAPEPQPVRAGSGKQLQHQQGGQTEPAAAPTRQADEGLVRIARSRNLGELAELIEHCTRCGLCERRKKAVPGQGVINPLVMVIGEAPGAEEDASGEPFVGPAGKYLDSWLAAIQLYRGRDVFIGNVVKCRPPGNRDPLPEEREACIPYLHRQIEIIRPKAILSVGRISSQFLTGVAEGIGRIRSQNKGYTYQGIPLVPTYHPSAVLRTPQEYRRLVWDDLQRLKAIITERT